MLRHSTILWEYPQPQLWILKAGSRDVDGLNGSPHRQLRPVDESHCPQL